MISNIYPVSLFSKPKAEYREQKSTGYIITGLFKSCLYAKYSCMILDQFSGIFILFFQWKLWISHDSEEKTLDNQTKSHVIYELWLTQGCTCVIKPGIHSILQPEQVDASWGKSEPVCRLQLTDSTENHGVYDGHRLFLASDFESIQSEEIKHVWYVSLILEHICFDLSCVS